MAAFFTNTALNQALDAITIDLMSLHNGSPGATGSANEVTGGGYSRQACTFNAASSGVRALNAQVSFTATALQAVTHVGLWLNAGTVFKGHQVLTGDAAFNALGAYNVTTSTQITAAGG